MMTRTARRLWQRTLIGGVAVALLGLTSCRDATRPTAPPARADALSGNSVSLSSNAPAQPKPNDMWTITASVKIGGSSRNCSDYPVSWSSSDATVVTVLGGNNGINCTASAGALKAGTAPITATLTDGSASGQISYTVTNPPPSPNQVAYIRFNFSTSPLTLALGSSQDVQAWAADIGLNPLWDVPITWSTSNAAVVPISTYSWSTQDATVHGQALGSAVITASGGGKSAHFTVNVIPRPLSVSLSGSTLVTLGSAGSWTASASEGTPPYSFRWFVDGVQQGGNTSGFGWGFGVAGYYQIGVQVTDAVGATATAPPLTVWVPTSPCYPASC